MDKLRSIKLFYGIGCALFIFCLFITKDALAYFQGIQLASNVFIFNPHSLTWQAIKNGKVIKSGKASGGRKYCPDIGRSCKTPAGTYHVISKKGANCRSSRYPVGGGGAKMPYCMFFNKYYAVHGSYDVPNYNASHGCIRVSPKDARWLHSKFMNIGTTVIVKPY